MPNCRHSSDIDASPDSQAMQNRAFSCTEQVSNQVIARTSKLERSLQTCYLSSRSILLPIMPVWTASRPLPRGERDSAGASGEAFSAKDHQAVASLRGGRHEQGPAVARGAVAEIRGGRGRGNRAVRRVSGA